MMRAKRTGRTISSLLEIECVRSNETAGESNSPMETLGEVDLPVNS
jgi:hypothetical protein